MSINLTTGESIALTALLINAASLVWGAAKLSSAVETLTSVVKELKEIQMKTANIVHNLIARVRVIEHELRIRPLDSEDPL